MSVSLEWVDYLPFITENQLPHAVRREVQISLEEKIFRAKVFAKRYARANACVSCSFGKDSVLVLWFVRQYNPEIPVVFCNSGIEFPETIRFKKFLSDEWNLNLIETKPTTTFWKIWDAHKEDIPDGSKLRKGRSVDRCCRQLKEKPFKDVVKYYKFANNFTGLTAMESRQRALRVCQLGQYYFNKTNNLYRMHLITFWRPDEVWQFSRKMNIPINPVYEKYGLKRCGCQFCTAHKGWRDEIQRTAPRVYQHMLQRYPVLNI